MYCLIINNRVLGGWQTPVRVLVRSAAVGVALRILAGGMNPYTFPAFTWRAIKLKSTSNDLTYPI